MGVLAFLYTMVGVSVPSFWTDEAATVSAVNREFPELWSMLGTVDAVHGAYYILMYGWTRIFGFSELAMRLPSLLAVAVAAGLLMALCRRLGGTAYGITAAAIFVILPRVQYVATDARSYALTVLGAVLATYLLVVIRESPSRLRWLWYGLTGLVTVSLSFYAVLLIAAHAVTLLADERLRRHWRALALASVGWLIPAGVVAAVASGQQFQIAWVPPIGASTTYEVAFVQFFSDAYYSTENFVSSPQPTPGEDFSMYGLAALVWVAALIGAILARKTFAVKLAVPWLVLPLAAVIAGSVITGRGYYLPRYVSFELAALPMLAAAPLLARRLASPQGKPPGNPQGGRVRKVRMAATAVGLLTALGISLPSYVGQRTEYGRIQSDDFRFIADTIHREARPGDAFVIGNDRDMAFRGYPEAFEGLNDPTMARTAAEWGRIFDRRYDVKTAKNRILKYNTVWVVELTSRTGARRAMEVIGYAPKRQLTGVVTSVTEFQRRPR